MILISRMQELLREGYEIRDAIMKSAEVRMRPVLMTSLAAAIGLPRSHFHRYRRPSASSRSEGTRFWNGSGETVSGDGAVGRRRYQVAARDV